MQFAYYIKTNFKLFILFFDSGRNLHVFRISNEGNYDPHYGWIIRCHAECVWEYTKYTYR